MRLIHFAIFAAVIVARPTSVIAQVEHAAETITAERVAHHISVIADDSMMGRATPSRGLDRTAQYVADQFQALGLKPHGKHGSWFRHYLISPQLDFARSRIIFSAGNKQAVGTFTTAAYLTTLTVPAQAVQESVLVVAGLQTRKSLEQASRRNKIVLYIAPTKAGAFGISEIVEQLSPGNRGVIIMSNGDSADFAQRLDAALRRPIVRVEDEIWVVVVRPEAFQGVREVLAAADVDLAQARLDTLPIIREVPSLAIKFEPQLDHSMGDSATAVNTIGVLPGTDSGLTSHPILYSAHMDHWGITQGRADSINNGADDNASGVAGLIELARAFSQGKPPRRPIIFLATSGGTDGLWGTSAFARFVAIRADIARLLGSAGRGIASYFTLDMIARRTNGSITVDGLNDIQTPTSLPWIATAHPELALTVIDGGTIVDPQSGHFPFAQIGVPGLYFHNGSHTGRPPTADSLSAVDADQEARILRLAFYAGTEMANADFAPQWTVEGRRRYLQIHP